MGDTNRFLQQAFPDLEESVVDALGATIVRSRVPAGTIICKEGEIGNEFFIICTGNVSVTKQIGNGKERILTILGASDFFGEMALVEHKPRAATVKALEETELITISAETFEQVLIRTPVAAMAIMRQISSSLRRSDRVTLLDLQHKNEQLRQALEQLQAAQAALVEKQLLEHELEIAAEVQRSILPTRFPDLPGFSYAVRTRPARQVGGDFYDIRCVEGKKLAVLTADVSGKDVHAAIYMAVARGLFLSEGRHSQSPADVIRGVHDLLIEIAGTRGMFVTAFYGIIDTENGQMRYSRAGHDPPLHYRQGKVQILPGEGRFLGLFDGISVDEREMQLMPGDLLVLFSDGVTDAINPAGEHFGVERVGRIIQEQAQSGAQAICDTVFDHILRFQETEAQFDDMTIQVIAYEKQQN